MQEVHVSHRHVHLGTQIQNITIAVLLPIVVTTEKSQEGFCQTQKTRERDSKA